MEDFRRHEEVMVKLLRFEHHIRAGIAVEGVIGDHTRQQGHKRERGVVLGIEHHPASVGPGGGECALQETAKRIIADLPDEGRRVTQLGRGAGDISRRAARGFDEGLRRHS